MKLDDLIDKVLQNKEWRNLHLTKDEIKQNIRYFKMSFNENELESKQKLSIMRDKYNHLFFL